MSEARKQMHSGNDLVYLRNLNPKLEEGKSIKQYNSYCEINLLPSPTHTAICQNLEEQVVIKMILLPVPNSLKEIKQAM